MEKQSDTSEWRRNMQLGREVPWFVLKQNSERDTLESHVTADVSTFLQKIFFQKLYANYMSFDTKLNADKSLQ